jgi:D-alanyl-D-alanine endopeptidase (penicillin-binding protein 7)
MFKNLLFSLLLLSSTAMAHNFTATNWVITDYKGKIIDGSGWDEVRPIASISKLMVVMTVIDANQDLEEHIGQHTRQELINLAIVHSDNQATMKLCENYPGGLSNCVRAMNLKAHKIGLEKTKFAEPTGLSVFNVSTADELVTIVLEASRYRQIVDASRMGKVEIKRRKKIITFNNTNPITRKRDDIIVSKTGYIRASGGCLVMMVDTDLGKRILVILNSKTIRTRIPDAEYLLSTY